MPIRAPLTLAFLCFLDSIVKINNNSKYMIGNELRQAIHRVGFHQLASFTSQSRTTQPRVQTGMAAP